MPIGLLVFLGLLLGFTLGLVGGGGSVLGVPILVYVSGVSVKEAIVMTLLVLASTTVPASIVSLSTSSTYKKPDKTYSLSEVHLTSPSISESLTVMVSAFKRPTEAAKAIANVFSLLRNTVLIFIVRRFMFSDVQRKPI